MTRMAALSAELRDRKETALLVTHPPDVRYLTGFTGSNAAVVVPARATGKRGAVLFTDGRYIQQARQQTRHATVVIADGPVLREACAWLQRQKLASCAIDAEHTSVAALEAMRRSISGRTRRSFFHPINSPVAALRQIKDAQELRKMRAAAALGCDLFTRMLARIEPGRREIEVAAELEAMARSAGASGMSFETIVAGGPRSAMPHGVASPHRLPRRGFVVLDFGVVLDGYCSDMTRTVHLGPATCAEREAYEAVEEAQLAAIMVVRPGTPSGAVDAAARQILERAGLAQHFTHSTGHGVGLEIHEGPRIAARQTESLQRNMVITIEPGVYLPGRFGIRIEDEVLVTARGAEILTPAPKGWIEL
jgi:Xaa-Pro aminopeptidase